MPLSRLAPSVLLASLALLGAEPPWRGAGCDTPQGTETEPLDVTLLVRAEGFLVERAVLVTGIWPWSFGLPGARRLETEIVNGRASFTADVGRRERRTLYVDLEGFVPKLVELPRRLAGGRVVVEVSLERGASISGTVVTREGRPIAGAVVECIPVAASRGSNPFC